MEPKSISVRVGGRVFETTEETLKKIPYFNAALTSGMKLPEFIDRSPDAFDAILNHARDHRYNIPAKYAPDASYYGLEVEEYDELPVLEKHAAANSVIEFTYGSKPNVMGRLAVFELCNDDVGGNPGGCSLVLITFKTECVCETTDRIKSVQIIVDGLFKRTYEMSSQYWLSQIAMPANVRHWVEYRRKVHNEHYFLVDSRHLMKQSRGTTQIQLECELGITRGTMRMKLIPEEFFFPKHRPIALFAVFHKDSMLESVPALHQDIWDSGKALFIAAMAGVDCAEYVYAITNDDKNKFEAALKGIPRTNITLLLY